MAVSYMSDDGADIVIPAGISAFTSGTNWRTTSPLCELDGTTWKVAVYSGTFALAATCPYVTPRRWVGMMWRHHEDLAQMPYASYARVSGGGNVHQTRRIHLRNVTTRFAVSDKSQHYSSDRKKRVSMAASSSRDRRILSDVIIRPDRWHIR